MIYFIYKIPDLFLPLLHILIMKKLMKTLLGLGDNSTISYIEWGVYYAFLVMDNISSVIPQQLLLAGNILFVFIISSSTYKKSLKQRCVVSLLINTIWMLVEIIVMLVLSVIGFDEITLQNAGSFISKLCVLLLSVLASRIIRNNRFSEISWRYFLIILLIPITSIYIMHHIFLITSTHNEYVTFSITASLLLLLVNYVIFEVYDRISHDTELRELNRLYEQQLELCSQQAEEREKSYLEIQRIRHDLKKYLSGLLGMIQKGQMTDAEKYIIEIFNDSIINQQVEISNSGDIIVDSLINYEYTLAQKEGIEFDSSILIPTSLPFHNGHLTIILGNLLENAIEACSEITDEPKFIHLDISYIKEVLQINLRNSCQSKHRKDNTGRYLTTKSNAAYHGLGLSSVRQAVANYQGEVNIYDTGNEFQVVVIMYSTKKK